MAKERARRVGSFTPSGDLIEGGYVVYSTKHGPMVEYVEDESGEGRGPWSVYRYSLDRHVPSDREFWNEDGHVQADVWHERRGLLEGDVVAEHDGALARGARIVDVLKAHGIGAYREEQGD